MRAIDQNSTTEQVGEGPNPACRSSLAFYRRIALLGKLDGDLIPEYR